MKTLSMRPLTQRGTLSSTGPQALLEKNAGELEKRNALLKENGRKS